MRKNSFLARDGSIQDIILSRHSLLALINDFSMQMKNVYCLVFTVNKTGKFGIKYKKSLFTKKMKSSFARRLRTRSRDGVTVELAPVRMGLRGCVQLERRAVPHSGQREEG